MNNDLISRSELIKAFNEAQVEFDEYYKGLGKAKVITDNAPTVELFCSYLSDGEVRQPCVESPCKHERPQGEWVVTQLHSIHSEDVYCPFCNARPTRSEYGYYLRDNFCHECGADMKGGAE